MTNYKIDRVQSVQILDKNTLEPIADLNGVGNVTEEIEFSSLKDEVLSFNHSASFRGELKDYSFPCNWVNNYRSSFYFEYYIPIMVQARWHKKPRINKKWLKRYGMKEDKVLVKCDVDSISPYKSYDPLEAEGFDIEFSNMQYKFRQDQLRKNLRIEMHY